MLYFTHFIYTFFYFLLIYSLPGLPLVLNEAVITPTKVGTSVAARELVENYNPSNLIGTSLTSTPTPPTPSPRNLNKKIEEFDREQFRLDNLNPKFKLFLALMEDEIEPTRLVVMSKGRRYSAIRANDLESVVHRAERKYVGQKRIEKLIEKAKLIAISYDPDIERNAETEVESVADTEAESDDDTKPPERFYEEPTNDPRYKLVSTSPSRRVREERDPPRERLSSSRERVSPSRRRGEERRGGSSSKPCDDLQQIV